MPAWPDGADAPELNLLAVPTFRDVPATRVHDVSGVDPSGEPIAVPLVGADGADGWTLLLFLSTTCEGCAELWQGAGDLAAAGLGDVRLVVVTRGPEGEDMAAVRRLAPVGATVVASTVAFGDYRVSGPPFFVVIGPDRPTVANEGVAFGLAQVVDQLARARRGEGPEVPFLTPPTAGGAPGPDTGRRP